MIALLGWALLSILNSCVAINALAHGVDVYEPWKLLNAGCALTVAIYSAVRAARIGE